MSLIEKLKKMQKSAGFKSQISLARASGIPQPTISRILKGEVKEPDLKTLRQLANACGWPLSDLVDVPDELQNSNDGVPTIPNAFYVPHAEIVPQNSVDGFEIRKISLKEKTVGTLFVHSREIVDNGWELRNLLTLSINDSSMEPSIFIGDTVMIDIRKTTPEDGKPFLLNYKGVVIIKRLFKVGKQRWFLRSDNPDKSRYPDRPFDDDIFIIGQVVQKVSTYI